MLKNIFHIKHKRAGILFALFFITTLILNILAFCMVNGIFDPTTSSKLFETVYTLLPVTETITVLSIFSYSIICIERACLYGKLKLKNKKLVFISFSLVDFLLAVFLIVYVTSNFNKSITSNQPLNIEQNIFMKIFVLPRIVQNNAYSNFIAEAWFFILVFSKCLVTPIILLAGFSRTKTIYQKFKKQLEFTKDLGFEYYDSEFFKQTQTNFLELNHKNGTLGEFELFKQIVSSDIKNIHFVFNRDIPKTDGLFTEIDLIVIHKKGIFVIENKDFNSDIYGDATSHDLTIINSRGKKITIYNPICQNEQHVKALKDFLKSKDLYVNNTITPIHSIVVFTDLRTNKSDNIIAKVSNIENTKSKVCTSQNIVFTINQLLKSSFEETTIDADKINSLLLSLNVRKKL